MGLRRAYFSRANDSRIPDWCDAGAHAVYLSVDRCSGGSALELITNQGFEELGTGVQQNPAVGLFRFLEYLPATEGIERHLADDDRDLFVTSADSGAMVLNML